MMLLVVGCGRDTLELFPGYGPSTDSAGAGSTHGGEDATSNADALAGADAADDMFVTAPGTDSSLPPADSALGDAPSNLGCLSDKDCHGENHRCQTGLHVCVQCIGDPNDCATQGAESKCNLVNYTCAVPCAADGSCPAPDVCDSQGVCADCVNSSQCPANQPRCFKEDCVCLSNADCPDGGVCGPDQTCM
jgi:hypothetical protein